MHRVSHSSGAWNDFRWVDATRLYRGLNAFAGKCVKKANKTWKWHATCEVCDTYKGYASMGWDTKTYGLRQDPWTQGHGSTWTTKRYIVAAALSENICSEYFARVERENKWKAGRLPYIGEREKGRERLGEKEILDCGYRRRGNSFLLYIRSIHSVRITDGHSIRQFLNIAAALFKRATIQSYFFIGGHGPKILFKVNCCLPK